VENLKQAITVAISKYFEYNEKKYFPDHIIIYRDGFGEGELICKLTNFHLKLNFSFQN